MSSIQRVLFPEFREVSTHVMDSFWKEMIEKFSHNDFPEEYSYDHNTRILSIFDKNINIDDGSSSELCTFIIQTSRENGVYSPNDLRLPITRSTSRTPPSRWKDVKDKNEKDSMIHTFISNKYSSIEGTEIQKVKSMITLGYSLSKVDIILEDGEITELKGIEYDQDSNEFSFSECE